MAPRKERALATRRRMISAAYRLFIEHGYVGTTMSAIADAADVAVQTLYFTFHTKGAVLAEVLGAAIVGFDEWSGPPPAPIDLGDPAVLRAIHPWFLKVEAEADARRALTLYVTHNEEVLGRAGPLIAVMHGASNDPEARAVFELGLKRRADAYRAFIKVLANKKGGLRPKLTVPKATDILLVIFSGETTVGLVARGWSSAQRRRWYVEVLTQQLLPGRHPESIRSPPRTQARRAGR